MERFSHLESLFDLQNKLENIVISDSFTQEDFKKLRSNLKSDYESLLMDAFFDRHPNWSVVSGEAAYRLFLLRNWTFKNSAKENKQEFRKIAEEICKDYYPRGSIFLSEQEATRIMKHIDERYSFSKVALADRHILIFCLSCSHRQYDSFCRSLVFTDDTIGADVYMLLPSNNDVVTPQSTFLHELGHVLTIMLTGNANVIPADFTSLFSSMFPNIDSHQEANEIFAHCFAMGVMTHPDFQRYDPFTEIPLEEKMLFDKYFHLKLEHWSEESNLNGCRCQKENLYAGI